MAVVAGLEKSPVSDGQAEPAMLAGAVRQRAAMGTDIPMLGRCAVGLSSGDGFQPLGAAMM